jgi:hypothetical protein
MEIGNKTYDFIENNDINFDENNNNNFLTYFISILVIRIFYMLPF